MPDRLVDRFPRVAPDEIVAALVPPPRFAAVRFDTYRPDAAEPSQPAALEALRAFATRLDGHPTRRRGIFGRGARAGAARPDPRPGVYLDGGFGVGKTHLLASLWHAAPAPKAYGTFVELTSLVGAIGFPAAVAALSGHRLVAVDEFELDDPGDTVLVSTLLTRLVEAGVALAASSNTQPEDLGAGRFAADDFRREIQGLSSRFDTLRIDGVDFRHRGLPPAPRPSTDAEVGARARATAGATEDDFGALIGHLARLHPSRYGVLVADVSLVCLHGVAPVEDQAAALRLVVLADRLYDRSVPVVASGAPVDVVFSPEMLAGPHRKKFQRALSRLGALARDGANVVKAGDAAGAGSAVRDGEDTVGDGNAVADGNAVDDRDAVENVG
ncbi:MAG: cell division protein ZapE [Frankia sp.]